MCPPFHIKKNRNIGSKAGWWNWPKRWNDCSSRWKAWAATARRRYAENAVRNAPPAGKLTGKYGKKHGKIHWKWRFHWENSLENGGFNEQFMGKYGNTWENPLEIEVYSRNIHFKWRLSSQGKLSISEGFLPEGITTSRIGVYFSI